MDREQFRSRITLARTRLRLAEEIRIAMGWPPEAKQDVFLGMYGADRTRTRPASVYTTKRIIDPENCF